MICLALEIDKAFYLYHIGAPRPVHKTELHSRNFSSFNCMQARAKEYCESLKRTANSSQWFLQRVNETSQESVRFWCLAAVQENVQTGYSKMDPQEKLAVSSFLFRSLFTLFDHL